MNNYTINETSTPKNIGVLNHIKKNEVRDENIWHEPVDGETLFQEIVNTFNEYLSLQEKQAEALALWTIFTHCYNSFEICPRLLITSPEKRCGKTTLLDIIEGMVWSPVSASNGSTAAVFREIDKNNVTLILDEADTFLKGNSELNGIINSGHRKSKAFVLRCDGDKHESKRFSTWAPLIISMIQKPVDTIIDRSIVIEMRRKKEGEEISRFSPVRQGKRLSEIQKKIARWVFDNRSFIEEMELDKLS